MLNDARVASLGFIKENICTTRINKEKNFKIKFQVLLKFARILPDYTDESIFQCRRELHAFLIPNDVVLLFSMTDEIKIVSLKRRLEPKFYFCDFRFTPFQIKEDINPNDKYVLSERAL